MRSETPQTNAQPIVFELCSESLEACLIAKAAGAHRIELCAALELDGLTPSHALLRAAVRESGLPVYMLLRPRAGDFVYTDREFALMQGDLRHGRDLGVSGFALGILRPDATVDADRTRRLVQLADGLEVTFHRAFDRTPSLPQALETVIETGCRRVLTSGGAADVYAGTPMLATLVQQARGRIEIAAGGGLRAQGAPNLVASTGARQFHSSARSHRQSPGRPSAIDPQDVQQIVQSLYVSPSPLG